MGIWLEIMSIYCWYTGDTMEKININQQYTVPG
jgi:hypothetical protein